MRMEKDEVTITEMLLVIYVKYIYVYTTRDRRENCKDNAQSGS